MSGARFGRLVGAGLAAVAAIAAIASSASAKGLEAEIVRSKGGIPTITADDYKGLGFGYGYALASDNICTIAEAYVTANAERSRYFGADADSPEGYTNLETDFFYARIKARGIVEELASAPPPAGPKAPIKQAIAGYVKGYNRYLDKTGIDNLPDPTCAGAPWVRKITKMDAYRRFYQLGQLASGQIAEDGIANAAPPAAPRAAAPAADGSDVAELGAALDARLSASGSNGWGLGGEATANGSGMVLANPHFPWSGPERFYQSHLRIPGKLNVSGASLFGVPVINIGHTENMAWTHTVSTAYRFTPIELTLAPGDPTSYLVDGQPVKMESNEVTVQTLQPDGSLVPVTRTLYTTHYGPVFNTLQGQSLFGWTPTHRLRAVRRQRREHAPAQPLLRHQPRAVDQGAARDPEEVRGDPVGEHDGRGLARARPCTRTSARSPTSRTRRRPAAPARSARSPSRRSGCRPSTARARSARRAPIPTRPPRASSAPRTCRS